MPRVKFTTRLKIISKTKKAPRFYLTTLNLAIKGLRCPRRFWKTLLGFWIWKPKNKQWCQSYGVIDPATEISFESIRSAKDSSSGHFFLYLVLFVIIQKLILKANNTALAIRYQSKHQTTGICIRQARSGLCTKKIFERAAASKRWIFVFWQDWFRSNDLIDGKLVMHGAMEKYLPVSSWIQLYLDRMILKSPEFVFQKMYFLSPPTLIFNCWTIEI